MRNPRVCVSMMWVHLIDISIESTCNFIKEEVVLLKWFLGMLKSNQTSLEGQWFNGGGVTVLLLADGSTK